MSVFNLSVRVSHWLFRHAWLEPRNWFKGRKARAAVFDAVYEYLNDVLSFWEGAPAPGELRAKDLLCAILAVERGAYSEALMLVESSKFRAQTIEGVRAFVGFSGKVDL